jgi:hypothetical protein
MLSIIIIWIYIAILSVIYGIGTLRLFKFLFNEPIVDLPSLPILSILGLCSISMLVGYLSLFIKIGLSANIVVVILAIIITYLFLPDIARLYHNYYSSIKSVNKYLIIVFLISIFFILLKATNQPSAHDTGLYHAQAIRWIEEYKVIPGLGNLHGRLAFNSSWFLLNALFGFSFLNIQPIHSLNSFLLLLGAIISYGGGKKLLDGDYVFTDIMKLCLIIPILFIFKDQLSSPSTDIPATMLICVICLYYLEVIISTNNGKIKPDYTYLAIIVTLSSFAITIKLSTLPLMIFIAYILVSKIIERKLSDSLIFAGLSLVIFMPWLLRNIILSGYLIYPYPAIDIFNYDWKIPLQSVLQEEKGIANYARNPGLIPDEMIDKGFFYWFPAWFKYLITAYKKKIEMMIIASCIILCGVILNIFRNKIIKFDYSVLRKSIIIYVMTFCGLLFWFLTAPDLRLGFGFFIVIAMMVYLPIMNNSNGSVSKVILLLTCLFLLYYEVVFAGKEMSTVSSRLFLAQDYPKVSLKINKVGRGIIYSPENREGYCWYSPLPCTPCTLSRLEFRGDKMEDGFRSK